MVRVEQFSVLLPDAGRWLKAASESLSGLEALESALSGQLSSCRMLLRWAVIRVQENALLCEGAYLAN